MHRSRVACKALQAAAESVHVRDLHRQFGKCVAVALNLEEALHRLLKIKALAALVDAVDALCMHSAAVVAVSERYAPHNWEHGLQMYCIDIMESDLPRHGLVVLVLCMIDYPHKVPTAYM
jgi:hypothetical protein